MSKYVDGLRERQAEGPDLCALGAVLESKGQEEYDAIVEAIFAKDEMGKYYPAPWLVETFREYGWSTHFFRRHRLGDCKSCQTRATQTS